MSFNQAKIIGIFAAFQNATAQTQLSGNITTSDSALKTIIAIRRSDGTLLGSVPWNQSARNYVINFPYQGPNNVMIISRDEGGTFNSLVDDSLTQGVITYTPDSSLASFIITDNSQLNKMVLFLSSNISVYGLQSNITLENSSANYGIANFVLTDGCRRGHFTNSGNSTIPTSSTMIGNLNGIRIEKLDWNGNDVLLGYQSNNLMQMSSNPFSDGSQVCGWSLNGNLNDVNGNYSIPTTGVQFVPLNGSSTSGIGMGSALNLSPLIGGAFGGLPTPFRFSTNSAFSISFKFIATNNWGSSNYATLINQNDAICICLNYVYLYVQTVNNGTRSGWFQASPTLTSAMSIHSFSLTYDGSGNIKTYLDNILYNTFSGYTISPSVASNFLTMGGQNTPSPGYSSSPLLSNFRIFNRVLTLAELTTLQNDLGTVPSISSPVLNQSEIGAGSGRLRLAGNNSTTSPVSRYTCKGFFGDEFNTGYGTYFCGLMVNPNWIDFDGSGSIWRGTSIGTTTNANVIGSTPVSVYTRFSLYGVQFDNNTLVYAYNRESYVLLSNNNLTLTPTQGGTWLNTATNYTVSSGMWYWEVILTAVDASSNVMIGAGLNSSIPTTYPGSNAGSYGFDCNNRYKYNNGGSSPYGTSSQLPAGTIVGVALDLTNGKIYFSVNGVWQNSGNPATQTNPAYTGLSGTFCAQIGCYQSGDIVTARFTSASQTYSPPSGFSSLDKGYCFSGIQCLWKSGDNNNGFGVGINASGNPMVAATNAGVLTTGSCTYTMQTNTWYRLTSTPTSITLSDDSNNVLATTTGLSCNTGTATGKESIGASILGSVLSQGTGNLEYFIGSISDIIVNAISGGGNLLTYNLGAARMGVAGLNYFNNSTSIGSSSCHETSNVSGSMMNAGGSVLTQMPKLPYTTFPKSTFTGNFTMSLAFNQNSFTNATIFGYHNNGIGWYGTFTITADSTGITISYSGNTNLTETVYFDSASIPSLKYSNNQWWRIVIVWVSSVSVNIYINGLLVSTFTGNYIISNVVYPLYIGSGGYSAAPSGNMNGMVENFQLFNYAATGDALQSILNQSTLSGLSGVYTTTLFNPLGTTQGNLAEMLLGFPLNTLNVVDSPASQKIAYSVSFDRLTYKHYVSSSWTPIASMDQTVTGSGNSNWYYWNGSSWVIPTSNTANNAISLAIQNASSYMNSTTLNTLNTSNFTAGGYSSSNGILVTAVTLYSSSAIASPEVTSINPNNTICQLSQVYPLSSYSGITASEIDFNLIPYQVGIDPTTALQAYVFVTGMTSWAAYTPGSSIPGITPGMNTSGLSLQVMLMWNISTGITPSDTMIRVSIT